MLGLGRLRCPKTYHLSDRIQMPGVPGRPAVVRFQESGPMAAVRFSSWSARCRIQPPGGNWQALNRKCRLQKSSRHSSRLTFRWSPEALLYGWRQRCEGPGANTAPAPGAPGPHVSHSKTACSPPLLMEQELLIPSLPRPGWDQCIRF